MLTRDDIPPLATAAGSAAAAGLALALWLSLPAYLSEPVLHSEPMLIGAVDPNLASYRQMAAVEGVGSAPVSLFVQTPAPADQAYLEPAAQGDDLASDRAVAREEAANRARQDHDEMLRVAWLERQREAWRMEAQSDAWSNRGGEGWETVDAAQSQVDQSESR